MVADESRHKIDSPTGRGRYDETYGTPRIRLCPCHTRDGREPNSACPKMQEFAARKFHGDLPQVVCIASLPAGRTRRERLCPSTTNRLCLAQCRQESGVLRTLP